MKCASIGTQAQSACAKPARSGSHGFTLIEALIALALIASFAGALGPLFFHARRIVGNAEQRVAALSLARSIIDGPLDRAVLSQSGKSGRAAELEWRLTTQLLPYRPALPEVPWRPYRVMVTVSWGPDQSISAETIRLARAGGS